MHEVKRRSVDQNLRIKLYYDESVYRLTKEQYNLIHQTVLPSAVSYWGQALRVRKTENKIRLNSFEQVLDHTGVAQHIQPHQIQQY